MHVAYLITKQCIKLKTSNCKTPAEYVDTEFIDFSRKDRVHYPEQFLIGTLGDGVHRSTNVVENAHYSGYRLRLDQLADYFIVEVVDRNPLDAFLHVLLLTN